MIDVAVSCPHPPLLLAGLTGGRVPEVEELRDACRLATDAVRTCDVVVVVGSAGSSREYDRGTPGPGTRYVPRPGAIGPAEVLPLSLGVGIELLGEVSVAVELHGISAAADPAECAALGRQLAGRRVRIGLLVLADGSARRGEKAPGYLDPRAAEFDHAVEQALATGDPAALADLDAGLADELLVAGRPAWQVLAGAFAGTRPAATLHYSGDPFGVWYPVVTWVRG